MVDIMIDIESWSAEPNATILTIGAIKFARSGELKPIEKCDTFYIRVDPKSCEAIGCHTDPNTVAWWNSQSEQARYEAIDNPDRVPIKEALTRLSKWIGGNNSVIWANSPSFDCVILESAYKRHKLPIPWKFWLTRDCRTLFDMARVRKYDLPGGGEHNALHDCHRQIAGVKMALKKLGL